MNIKDIDQHEYARKKLWCDVWVAVSSSSSCLDGAVPVNWADKALKDFDDRFEKPILTVEE